MLNEKVKFVPKITPAQVKKAQADDKRKIAEKVENATVKGEKQPEKANEKEPEKAVAKETEKALPPAKKPKPEKKSKAKETKEAKKDSPLAFPTTVRINDYGFINVRKGLLDGLGWAKGITLKLDKNADGSVTIRKA